MPPRDALVQVDLSPVLLATALARVFTGVGYEVEVGDREVAADVAVVSTKGESRVPIVIELPPLGGRRTLAKVSNHGTTRRVRVRHLQDLLRLIEIELAAAPLPFEA